jgi:hypothetical protein
MADDPNDPNKGPGEPGFVPEAPKLEPLPSNEELHAMKRAELDSLADARGVDVSGASNKDEVIELLRKDARKRK